MTRLHPSLAELYVVVRRDDLELLLKGWKARSGLRRKAGVDPSAVTAAAFFLESSLLAPIPDPSPIEETP